MLVQVVGSNSAITFSNHLETLQKVNQKTIIAHLMHNGRDSSVSKHTAGERLLRSLIGLPCA